MAKVTSDEILSAAKNLFQQKGYKSTSMAQIAEKAGISIGTLYAHFQSKEQLFQKMERPELKQYNPEDTARRQNILNSALKIFSEKGYFATTMDEIAADCSYSKTVLYQYFTGKESLFSTLFSNVDFFDNNKEFAFKAENFSLHDFLNLTGLYFLELFEDPYRLNLLRVVMGELHSFPKSGEILYRNTIDRMANEVARQFAVYSDLHLIPPVNFKLAARSYLGLLYSFVLSDQILYPSANQFTKEQIVGFAVPLFEKGLQQNLESAGLNVPDYNQNPVAANKMRKKEQDND